jgi:hypothetical protein
MLLGGVSVLACNSLQENGGVGISVLPAASAHFRDNELMGNACGPWDIASRADFGSRLPGGALPLTFAENRYGEGSSARAVNGRNSPPRAPSAKSGVPAAAPGAGPRSASMPSVLALRSRLRLAPGETMMMCGQSESQRVTVRVESRGPSGKVTVLPRGGGDDNSSEASTSRTVLVFSQRDANVDIAAEPEIVDKLSTLPQDPGLENRRTKRKRGSEA